MHANEAPSVPGSRVESFVLQGIDAVPCEIEIDLCPSGLSGTTVVGLPDTAVRESIDRVRAAIRNCGYRYPWKKTTVSLAPGDLRKEGPVFDLPISIALLLADGALAASGSMVASHLFAGELALDGRLRPVRGAVSLATLARSLGRAGVVLPRANAVEAAAVGGIDVHGFERLDEVVAFLQGGVAAPTPEVDADRLLAACGAAIDCGEIRGQEAAKRAMTIAAAGGHNLLLIGPAGAGKTMMARALPGLLPPMTRAEALEVTRIHSCAGLLGEGRSLVCTRPVRCPHHTASTAAIVGGGRVPRPGEVSLAHHGVLFLDELPEFSRGVLESLREPLEDGVVTIARAHGATTFPARVLLVAAMNPTHRGHRAVGEAGQREQERYVGRISGPLIDRIDLHVEVSAVPFERLAARTVERSTSQLRRKVDAARRHAARRGDGIVNARLRSKALDEACPLDAASRRLLAEAMDQFGLSARAYDKIRRIARTIADLEQAEIPTIEHVAEAVSYRVLDRTM